MHLRSIGAMAVAPALLMAGTMLVYPQIADRITIVGIAQQVLVLLIAAVASVCGTGLINTLRREVFEAKQIGQYRLVKLLGAGGMGEVYLAEHRMLKRPCAIKLIHPDRAGDPHVLARFEREVQMTARLSHWNTVEIFDYGRTDDGTFFYVMEYLPGLSLEDLLERHGPVPADRVIHILRQTCPALREAHEVGLIHRDAITGSFWERDDLCPFTRSDPDHRTIGRARARQLRDIFLFATRFGFKDIKDAARRTNVNVALAFVKRVSRGVERE